MRREERRHCPTGSGAGPCAAVNHAVHGAVWSPVLDGVCDGGLESVGSRGGKTYKSWSVGRH